MAEDLDRLQEQELEKEEEFKQGPLVEQMQIEMSDEQEGELSHWITQRKDAISKDRTQFLERQKKYLFNFDDFISEIRKGPWEEAANLHMPLTAIMVKSFESRLYNIFSQPDATTLSPREGSDDKRVDILKQLRTWYIWDYINGYRGIKGVTKELCQDVTQVGFGIIMKSWDLKQRKALMLVNNEVSREMEDLQGEAKEAIAAGEKIDLKPYKEVQKIITVFEGTKLITLPFENTWFPNEIPESSDLDHPPMVLVSTKMFGSELSLKEEQKLYRNVKEVLQEKAQSAETDEKTIKEHRDSLTGYDKENSVYHNSEYDVEYAFCTYDYDRDGISEELVVTRSARGTILSVLPLDRISRSGRRPLFKFDCFSKSRQAYSRGIPEFMYPLQQEMDMDHNLRMDYLQLQTTPFGTYRSASSLDNQEIRIAPGKFIPVDEPDDLKPFTFRSNAQIFAQEEDRLWRYAELLTSVTPNSMGLVGNAIGPTRSTSGVLSLLQQTEKQFRPMVDQFALQWRNLEYALLEDLDYRVDPQQKLRILGASIDEDPVFKDKSLSEVNNFLKTTLLDLKIDVASISASDEVRRNEATLIMGQILNPSLLQQSGIVGNKALIKAISDYLKAYGKDPKQYLDEPQFTSQPMTLWQEIQICGQGEVPSMSMQDNHEEKVNGLSQFLQSPEFGQALSNGLYDMNAEAAFQRTIKKHQNLMQALQAKGQPNAAGSQGMGPAGDMNAVMAGTSPNQGGPNLGNTTSRDVTNNVVGAPETQGQQPDLDEG